MKSNVMTESFHFELFHIQDFLVYAVLFSFHSLPKIMQVASTFCIYFNLIVYVQQTFTSKSIWHNMVYGSHKKAKLAHRKKVYSMVKKFALQNYFRKARPKVLAITYASMV